MAHTRKFGGRTYKLWNVYYGAKQIRGRLKKDIEWLKSHSFHYRVTNISAKEPTGGTTKGKALWVY